VAAHLLACFALTSGGVSSPASARAGHRPRLRRRYGRVVQGQYWS
jgi:hypothetical protein